MDGSLLDLSWAVVFFVTGRSRVVWAESDGVLRHDPFEVVSPWFAPGACAAEVLGLRVGKGKALVENLGDKRLCIMYWMAREAL